MKNERARASLSFYFCFSGIPGADARARDDIPCIQRPYFSLGPTERERDIRDPVDWLSRTIARLRCFNRGLPKANSQRTRNGMFSYAFRRVAFGILNRLNRAFQHTECSLL